jgi:UDP-N-acetylglucosamine 3-dehydrogenase
LKKIKIGLVGFGSWGKRHYESWKRIPTANLVGIYDPAHKGKLFTSSLSQLISKADAIDIVVPANNLVSVAIATLESSKDLLIEKPMAINLQEANKLLNFAKYQNQLTMVGFIERFNPVFGKLHSIIQKLDDHAKIFCQRSGSPTLVTKQTGVLKDLAIHDLDLLRWYFGEPDSVTIRSKDDFFLSQVEVKFGNIEAIVISDCLGPKIRRWVLTYPHDNIFSYFESNRWRLYMNDKEIPIKWQMPLERELTYFIECIINETKPSPSIQDGFKILEIIENAEIHQ